MDPRTKLTLLAFTKTTLTTKYEAQVENLNRLHATQSAIFWLGEWKISSLMQKMGTKVQFTPQDTINTVYLRVLKSIKDVVNERLTELKQIKIQKSKHWK